MSDILIEGLNIPVVQSITGIRLGNARLVERTEDGMQSNVDVTVMNGDVPLGNRKVRHAIHNNTFLTWEELNVGAQTAYAKDFLELTLVESNIIQGQVLATKMITAINEADVGIAIDDINTLVTSIVQALA